MRLLLVAFALLTCSGCTFWRADPLPAITPPPVLGPVAETADQEVQRLTGELARARVKKEDADLAPVRTTLRWAEGISVLGILAGVGLAVAAVVWSLGFAWKIPAGIAAAFAGILATSLATAWALGHVPWIIGAVVLVAAVGVLWVVRKHLTLVGASRALWDAVPDEATLPPHVEHLMARIVPPGKA